MRPVPRRRRRDYLLLPDEERPEQGDGDEPAPPSDPVAEARTRRRRRIIAAVVGVVLLIAAIGFGWYWFSTLRWLQSTDDAYTQADVVTIAPKVSGYVGELLVGDNQRVKAGQPLLRIDPRDYRASADQAKADVAAAEADIRNLDAQLAVQQSTVDQAKADIAAAQANLTFARQDSTRYTSLQKAGVASIQRTQQAQADADAKQATLSHNQATLAAAVQNMAVLRTQRDKAEATLQRNRALVAQAELNLGYTTLTAPVDGAVGDRSVQQGQYVRIGDRLMSIVPMGRAIYVVANFKETEIERMFRGEGADLTIDTFPGVHFKGVVDSLAPGSGAQFALLPPENATGNFTKIVQRVPVKILIRDAPPERLEQLRPGLSVVATVDLRTEPAAAERYTLAAPRP